MLIDVLTCFSPVRPGPILSTFHLQRNQNTCLRPRSIGTWWPSSVPLGRPAGLGGVACRGACDLLVWWLGGVVLSGFPSGCLAGLFRFVCRPSPVRRLVVRVGAVAVVGRFVCRPSVAACSLVGWSVRLSSVHPSTTQPFQPINPQLLQLG